MNGKTVVDKIRDKLSSAEWESRDELDGAMRFLDGLERDDALMSREVGETGGVSDKNVLRFSNNKINYGRMDDELLLVEFINDNIPDMMERFDEDTVLDILEYTEGNIIEVEDGKINLVSMYASVAESDVGVLGLLGEAAREAWSQVEQDVQDNSENPDYSPEDSGHYGSFERLKDYIGEYSRECVREIDDRDDLQRRVLCDLLRPGLHGAEMDESMAGDFLTFVKGDENVSYSFDGYRKVFFENDPDFEIFDHVCSADDIVDHFIGTIGDYVNDFGVDERRPLLNFLNENFYDRKVEPPTPAADAVSEERSKLGSDAVSQKSVVDKFVDEVKSRVSSGTDRSLESMLEAAGRAMKSLPDSEKSLISGWLSDNNIRNGSQMVKFLLDRAMPREEERKASRSPSRDDGYGR